MESSKFLASGLSLNQDMADFLEFRRQWDDRTLENDHPVVVKATKWAKTVAYKFHCPERADDLRQIALMNLAASNYRGDATLDTYIMRILLHSNTAEWRKGGGKEKTQLPSESVELAAERSQKLFEEAVERSKKFCEEVLRRVTSDKLMKELLMKRPELQRTIVEIVLDFEEQVGSRRLAELASQRLGRKVTRHEVDVALKQLREALRRSSDHH